ncbi:membrane protein [Marinithermofilum abyssi]|uniref:Membrane protein n=1 Tax=Marinithermofilum abyssi TaxID=1571185 RepID=A0A8J2YAY2_9BACL|nr:acyltransferase [Marinithermofilum abyssi]GGE23795.1 membrane protein [Marinithermofilum abyssi]
MQRRIQGTDFIKGVAILGVILIHVTAFSLRDTKPLADGGLFFALNQLARFSVPVFFMLSGLFLFYHYYDKFTAAHFIKKRFMYILIPYLIWSIVYLIYAWETQPQSTPHTLKRTLVVFLTGQAYYHLYFIVVMTQFYILLPFLIRLFRKFGGLTIVSFAFVVKMLANSVTWWEASSQVQWIAYFPEKALFPVWLFYFCLGGWLGQRIDRLKLLGRAPLVAVAVLFGSTGLLMLVVSFFHRETVFFNFSVLVYSIVSFVLLFLLGIKWKQSWLSVLGRYSFGLYMIHPLVLNALSKWTPAFLPETSWTEFSFILFTVLGLSLGLSVFIRRLPYSYLLIGK